MKMIRHQAVRANCDERLSSWYLQYMFVSSLLKITAMNTFITVGEVEVLYKPSIVGGRAKSPTLVHSTAVAVIPFIRRKRGTFHQPYSPRPLAIVKVSP